MTWLYTDGSRTGRTAIMRVSDEEKQLLEVYRRRLGLRSEADVMRVSLDLLERFLSEIVEAKRSNSSAASVCIYDKTKD